jgi:hypothetical protein
MNAHSSLPSAFMNKIAPVWLRQHNKWRMLNLECNWPVTIHLHEKLGNFKWIQHEAGIKRDDDNIFKWLAPDVLSKASDTTSSQF